MSLLRHSNVTKLTFLQQFSCILCRFGPFCTHPAPWRGDGCRRSIEGCGADALLLPGSWNLFSHLQEGTTCDVMHAGWCFWQALARCWALPWHRTTTQPPRRALQPPARPPTLPAAPAKSSWWPCPRHMRGPRPCCCGATTSTTWHAAATWTCRTSMANRWSAAPTSTCWAKKS